MAAISATFFTSCGPAIAWSRSRQLWRHEQTLHGIPAAVRNRRQAVRHVDFAQIEAEVARGCKLLYLESPTKARRSRSWTSHVGASCAQRSGAARRRGHTFATPSTRTHCSWRGSGMHSAAKYLGGSGCTGRRRVWRGPLVKKLIISVKSMVQRLHDGCVQSASA